MNVGIVGCGTAGGAAALFLARAGHRVTVYERVPDPLAIGAGIILQPTGLSTLMKLELFERVVSRGARLERLHAETRRGRTLIDLRYGEVQPGLYGLGIHRGALFEAIFEEVQRARLELRLGQPIETLTTADGARTYCVAPNGTRFGPHELVLIADGARSMLRAASKHPSRSFDYRWGAAWFVARDPERKFHSQLHQVVDGTHTLLGLLPTGFGPGTKSDNLVSLYWSVRDDQVEHLRGKGFSAWKERVRSLNPRAESVLAQLERGEQLLFSSYKHVVMPRWHHGAIAYLGDAGHAMSPQLGQGANLALYDAMILAECLAREPEHAPRALELYSKRRRAHLRFYQLATRALTPFFQGDQRFLGTLRDLGLPLMNAFKPLRMVMSRSMIGIKRGVVRPSLPIAALPALPKKSDV